MKFISYFDYLGFADFIQYNDLSHQKKVLGNIFRDIENALAHGNIVDGKYGKIADLSKLRINCINFSDTIICWTNDDKLDDLIELLKITHTFNWTCIDYFFPIRGALVHGEIEKIKYDFENVQNGSYAVNSVFGKGLVNAHAKAESMDWAGSVIDQSIIEYLYNNKIDIHSTLSPYAKEYIVPYKGKTHSEEKEWAFGLVNEELNDEAFENMKNNIVDNFKKHNKRVDSEGVQRKIKNTIDFLESYKNAN